MNKKEIKRAIAAIRNATEGLLHARNELLEAGKSPEDFMVKRLGEDCTVLEDEINKLEILLEGLPD